VPFSSYLTLNNIVTLKSGLDFTQGHRNWCHSKAWVRFPIRLLYCIVTMAVPVAVCEIFSIKEWYDLENRVRVRSRSLEMAPFDRSHTSFYSPSIVTIWRYFVSCVRYSDLLVENREIFIPTCL